MAKVTRTLGPLHFEELEPKRFEDLVRQLFYEFKPWRLLEAVGRGSGDDGFDARGLEIASASDDSEPGNEASGQVASAVRPDRPWLIQCKRDRSITSAQLSEYLSKINVTSGEPLHGLIFAAASEFSKSAHERFRENCRDKGVRAGHLWGRSELEDLLHQPENDHLLFAYFGFSSAIRQRTKRTELRSQIATKKRLQQLVETDPTQLLLIRNAFGDIYPRIPRGSAFSELHWRLCPFDMLSHRGLVVEWASFMAFTDAGPTWDAADANGFRQSHLHAGGKWHRKMYETAEYDRARKFWNALDEKHKARVNFLGVIPYERIIAIDDVGDDYFSGAHIFCRYERGSPISSSRIVLQPVKPNGLPPIRLDHPDSARRIEMFPKEFRMPLQYAQRARRRRSAQSTVN